MKRYLFTLVLTLAIIIPSWSMSYEEARQQAWFLTDKMAYELNLTPEQYNRAYEINLDYLMSIRTASDCEGLNWRYRDADFRCVLFDWQYTLFSTLDYFFRPIRWMRSAWYYPVFEHYRVGYFYFDCPAIYASYRGGMWNRRNHNGRSPYYAIRLERGRGMRDHYDAGEWRPRNNGGGSRPDVADGRGSGTSDRRGDNVGRNNRNDNHAVNGNNSHRYGNGAGTDNGRGSTTFHPSWETGKGSQSGNTDGGEHKQDSASDAIGGKPGSGQIARPITNIGENSFGSRRGTTSKVDNSVIGQSRRGTTNMNVTNRSRAIVGTMKPATSAAQSNTSTGRTHRNGTTTGGRTTTTTTRPSQGTTRSATRSTPSATRSRQSTMRSTIKNAPRPSSPSSKSTTNRRGRTFGH